MFEKRTDIYKKKDKETWAQIKTALKEGGLTGFKAGHYLQESVMAGGCGAKLDPRDFGQKGKVDREVYFIKVKESDVEKANEILLRNGLVAEIDETLMTDAALKTKRSYI
ncbi:MAG: hypothetical protein IJI04_06065 [Lachnospiraceae bacterium]|nr:hypothetical protein [Lachnospiraceae bacterium]